MSDFDKIAEALAASPLKTAVVQGMRKEADFRTSLMRALGGTAVGGAAGGGLGALMAHLQGGDVAAGARKGAIGGAGFGGMVGGLSGMAPAGTLSKVPEQYVAPMMGASIGTMAGAFTNNMTGTITGGGGAAAEQAQREMGRFSAQQQIKQQQTVNLAPQHVTAFARASQDDVIAHADPELMHSSFETMKRFAPNLAADPNAVKSFLRESATWGTGPSYATLKNLADAERAIVGAYGAGSH